MLLCSIWKVCLSCLLWYARLCLFCFHVVQQMIALIETNFFESNIYNVMSMPWFNKENNMKRNICVQMKNSLEKPQYCMPCMLIELQIAGIQTLNIGIGRIYFNLNFSIILFTSCRHKWTRIICILSFGIRYLIKSPIMKYSQIKFLIYSCSSVKLLDQWPPG